MFKKNLSVFWISSAILCSLTHAEDLPQNCFDPKPSEANQCATPFGTKLGQFGEVVSYSNCHSGCESGYITKNEKYGSFEQYVQAPKWSSMRFIKDHFFFNLGLVVEDLKVQKPSDLFFEMTKLLSIREKEARYYYVDTYENSGKAAPLEGDILVYYTESEGLSNSPKSNHAAVIAKIEFEKTVNKKEGQETRGRICLVEDNFTNLGWSMYTFNSEEVLCSRIVPITEKNGYYSVEEDPKDVMGWLRIRGLAASTPRRSDSARPQKEKLPLRSGSERPLTEVSPLLKKSASTSAVPPRPAAAGIEPSPSSQVTKKEKKEKKQKEPKPQRRSLVDRVLDSTVGKISFSAFGYQVMVLRKDGQADDIDTLDP